ncbi:MAG: hypothetical protein KatS3mg008_1337 [Acidimicrobiales bacterium]|nr:MAG: hypothetical protein KatS3mg008_1337 [Acidimicrobiales bacterium]
MKARIGLSVMSASLLLLGIACSGDESARTASSEQRNEGTVAGREEPRRKATSAPVTSSGHPDADAGTTTTTEATSAATDGAGADFCVSYKKAIEEAPTFGEEPRSEDFDALASFARRLESRSPRDIRDSWRVVVSAFEKTAERLAELEGSQSATSTSPPEDPDGPGVVRENALNIVMSTLTSPDVQRAVEEIEAFLEQTCGFTQEDLLSEGAG